MQNDLFLKTKDDIKHWLSEMGIYDYTIKADLRVNTLGVVNLSNKGLTYLPVQFGIVKGHFDCSYNQLTSLKGSPHRVDGSFLCMGNLLNSLEFSPKLVGNIFNCSSNQLVNLLGSPKKIGGNVFCKNNQLTSLKGITSYIDGTFDCSHNQLSSLENGPDFIDGSLWCEHNPLTHFDTTKMAKIKEVIIMSSNGLDYLDSYIKNHGYLELPGKNAPELLSNAFLKKQLDGELTYQIKSSSKTKI